LLTLLDFNALSIAQLFRVNKNRQHVCIKFSMSMLNEHINTYDDRYFVDISTETLLFLLIIAQVDQMQSVDAFCALKH